MHLDNIRFTKKVLISLALLSLFLLLGALVWYSVQMLLLIFAGILLATFIRGVAGFLFGRLLPLPEKAGILAALVILLALLCAFFILLVPQLLDQGEKLAQQLPEALKLLQEEAGLPPSWARELFETAKDSAAMDSTGKIARRAMGLFATTLGAITSLFIMLFVGLYLSFSPHYYRQGILQLFPGEARKGADQALQALNYTLSRWLIGRFIGMLLISVFTFIGLLLLNIPMALALATLAGLLTFIPNIGPVISAVPAILLGFTVSPMSALLVVLLFVVIQGIESYLITPIIQQHEVALPPVLTLSSQVVLGSTLGILGLALATPLTAAALVLVKLLYVERVLGDETGVKGIDS